MSQVNLKAVVVSGEGDKIDESLTGTAAPMQPSMERSRGVKPGITRVKLEIVLKC